ARGVLLVVDHQKPLRPRSELARDLADRLTNLVGGRGLGVVALRAVGKHPGGGPARARVRVSRGLSASLADQEAAVRAALGLARPIGPHVAFDQQEAMRAEGLDRDVRVLCAWHTPFPSNRW